MKKEKDTIIGFSSSDYAKKEITPYVKTDYDYNDYIPFGPDNLFPQAMALFSRLSPNHRGVLLSKEKYHQGDGIIGTNQEAKTWIERVNSKGENLNSLQEKFWIDERIGNVWIELTTDKRGSFFYINHIDSTKCRLSKDQKEVLIHPDWSKYEKSDNKTIKLSVYPNWSQDEKNRGILKCVYHKFDYEPEFTYYGIPSYISGKDSIQIDFKTNKWNLARLVNGFRPDSIMFVPVKDTAESAKVLKEVDKHIGEGNQGKVLTVTKSRAMEGQKAEDVNIVQLKTEDTGSWMKLHEQALSDIIMAHAWYRSLCSIPDNTGFDTTRILNEYNIALIRIKQEQRKYISLYQKLYKEIIGKDLEMEFQNSPPLETDQYLFIWEARQRRGLDFDPKDPAQQIIITND